MKYIFPHLCTEDLINSLSRPKRPRFSLPHASPAGEAWAGDSKGRSYNCCSHRFCKWIKKYPRFDLIERWGSLPMVNGLNFVSRCPTVMSPNMAIRLEPRFVGPVPSS